MGSDYNTASGSVFVGYFGSDLSAEMISPHHEVQAHRLLAGEGYATYFLDYSVMSFVILTSVLVLAVEAGRHKLDSMASGNPFFYTVLNTMYHEITTLGIVEMALYLMHKYWESFNYHVEATFVDVHFTLFYTALFNALQGCLIRIIAGWRTDRWMQTEDIDVGHYVAIRKEYDRVDRKLNAIDGIEEFENVTLSDKTYWDMLQAACKRAKNRFRHPHLSRRRNELLVPIRYHELRTHFLETNDLPPSFKVSHYLKRSLTSVLLDFVHINAAAWIALMATANVIYFLAGVLLEKTRNESSITWFLTGCFVVMVVAYIILSIVMSMKMEKIYSQTLRMKLSAESGEETTETFTALASQAKSVDQLSLFWFKSPRLIISIFQYMQFGYAFAISFIFIYFKEFKAQDYPVSPSYLILLLILSYLVVLYFMSIMIPRFTLCTSLGQLVNKARLNETKAKVKLNEEVRRLEALEEEKRAEEKIARRKRELEARQRAEKVKAEQKAAAYEKARAAMGFSARTSDALESRGSGSQNPNRKRSPSDGVKMMADMLRPSSPPNKLSFAASNQLGSSPLEEAGKVVGFDVAKALLSKDERKLRRRAQSEGVAQMKLSLKEARETPGVGRPDALSELPIMPSKKDLQDSGRRKPTSVTERKERRRRMKSQSDGVGLMRLNAETVQGWKSSLDVVGEDKPGDTNITMISEMAQMSANDLPEIPQFKRASFIEKAAQVFAPMLSPVTSEDEDGADMTMMSELSAKDRPEIPPNQRGKSRRTRATYDKRRALSEGVAQMRLSMKDAQGTSREDSCVVGVNRPNAQPVTRSELSQHSSKNLPETGLSEGVGLMRLSAETTQGVVGLKRPDAQSVTRSELSQPSSKHLPESDRRNSMPVTQRRERRPRTRRASVSEGVGLMRLNADTTLGRKSPLDFVSGDKPADANITMISKLARISSNDLPEIPSYKTRNFSKCRAKSDEVSSVRPSSKAPPLSSPTMGTTTSLDKPQSPAPETARVTFSEKISQDTHGADQVFAPMLSPVMSEDTSEDEYDDDDITVGTWDGEIFDAIQVKDPWLWRLNDSLATFFLGRTYTMLSLLFGPIACFFIVAMRVEGFNIASCLLDDVPNTVHLPLNWSFWMEVASYCAMTTEMVVVIVTFRTRWHEGFEYSILAAMFGILINVMCLLLLLFSEMGRCCTAYDGDDESRRFLAAEYDSGGYDYECTDKTEACSCSDFGARTYGGLGWIEPFTALIALSPLRFFFAGYIISLFSISGREDIRALNKRHVSHHSHGLGVEEIHKMREYWMVCIGQNSFVAKSQGLFSGEMLLCMLGLYSDKTHLAAAVDHEGDNTSLSKSSAQGSRTSAGVVEANLFVSQAVPDNLETDHRFQYPTARLIRKMRRCESIMLPLVKNWIACDIVLTSHELILFDIDVENDSPTSQTDTLLGGNGGKDLYLHDVAKGRKVLSLFSLDEIDSIGIEHRLKIGTTDFLFDLEQDDQTCREHWQGSTMTTESYDMSSTDARWTHVDEDRLKIRFKNYTLFLRFFADLGQKETEAKHEVPTTGFLNDIGTQTKLWCKTIARLRGKANLNQDLPNFGAGDDLEMGDFIEHCERSDMGKKSGLHHHRRASSFGLESWWKKEQDEEPGIDSANDEHGDRSYSGRSLRHHHWNSFHHRRSSSYNANDEHGDRSNSGTSLRHHHWNSFNHRRSRSFSMRKKEPDEEAESDSANK